MRDLVAFLRARLNEDKQAAQAETARRAEWKREFEEDLREGNVPAFAFNSWDSPGAPGDPARVLAEVKSKRTIVKLHRPYGDKPRCIHCDWQLWPCPTARLLAASYADHPDYDPAWAVEAADA